MLKLCSVVMLFTECDDFLPSLIPYSRTFKPAKLYRRVRSWFLGILWFKKSGLTAGKALQPRPETGPVSKPEVKKGRPVPDDASVALRSPYTLDHKVLPYTLDQ